MPDAHTNNPGRAPKTEASFKPGTHLLEAIRALRQSVGDSLNDDEFTRLLLLQAVPPTEAGFAFLSFSDGVVTLSVPQQNLANWYSQKEWIAPEKEKIARAIAEKYGLFLCEPPDQPSNYRFARHDAASVHHHLELCSRQETVVVAHPKYLKIRLYGQALAGRFDPQARTPLPLAPDLLQDLAALYCA